MSPELFDSAGVVELKRLGHGHVELVVPVVAHDTKEGGASFVVGDQLESFQLECPAGLLTHLIEILENRRSP